MDLVLEEIEQALDGLDRECERTFQNIRKLLRKTAKKKKKKKKRSARNEVEDPIEGSKSSSTACVDLKKRKRDEESHKDDSEIMWPHFMEELFNSDAGIVQLPQEPESLSCEPDAPKRRKIPQRVSIEDRVDIEAGDSIEEEEEEEEEEAEEDDGESWIIITDSMCVTDESYHEGSLEHETPSEKASRERRRRHIEHNSTLLSLDHMQLKTALRALNAGGWDRFKGTSWGRKITEGPMFHIFKCAGNGGHQTNKSGAFLADVLISVLTSGLRLCPSVRFAGHASAKQRCVLCSGWKDCAWSLNFKGVTYALGTKCYALGIAVIKYAKTMWRMSESNYLAECSDRLFEMDARTLSAQMKEIAEAHKGKGGW